MSKKVATSKDKNLKQKIANLPFEPTKIENNRFFFTESQRFATPNLIEIQLNSYDWFLNEGVKELLDEISPITDFSGKKLELKFLSHKFDKPKFTPFEAKRKNTSFDSNLRARVQLINKISGEIKEQEVFLGQIPLMTKNGTFIVNGIERVVVNQLMRSPGIFFLKNDDAFTAKIIPRRGIWLEIEVDKKGIITAKIDRRRKILLTQLFRIFGYETDQKILQIFKDIPRKNLEDDFILKTLEKDPTQNAAEAFAEIYRKLRPGDMATAENAKAMIEAMFFDFKRYDLGPIARYKINKKFNLKTKNNEEHRVFQVKDFVCAMREFLKLNVEGGDPDDIDHLSNRRIRSVGELVQNKFRIGLLRLDRIAKDRMTVLDLDQATPVQLVNARPLTAAMREFFMSSQLSQFMDQTNPLSELSHKRRLSAMGPGGLSRERASFDVRDVHSSHYGRICPISTPEGPNIGLVMHLANFAKVNEYGFLKTPFRKVENKVALKFGEENLIGRIIDEEIPKVCKSGEKIDAKLAKKILKLKKEEIAVRPFLSEQFDYFDADEEKALVIAQANSMLDEKKQFVNTRISARKNCKPVLAHVRDVTHIDVSPKQIISESTSMIPFLENDDNTRALMGSNMQRQAVPVFRPQAPLIGTGFESVVARATDQIILAEEDGTVESVDANKIVVKNSKGKNKTYELTTFVRSNQTMCFGMRPAVYKGQKIKINEVLANGASVDEGELALGRNLLVAYASWEGCNFEDAIIVSSRVVQRGDFDSVHIENYTIEVRETKLGPEIITRDIPNVGETRLKDLDADGIVRIGATVRDGDILVGKITPKGETKLSPEERLLQSIFGEKSKDVRDSSLRLPGGAGGKVVDVQIFTREEGHELPNGVLKQIRVFVAQTRKLQVGDKMAGRHGNKGVISVIVPEEDMPFMENGTPIDILLNPLGVGSRMNIGQVLETHLGWVAQTLGIKFATPVLNGISTQMIEKFLTSADLPKDGRIQLYDGKTGEPFSRRSTVGTTYMLKLSHMIEDKMHARSVGPYSIVTQQPLGGKAQHGGQRFGEMEVWALEAYGAAHTLQEMLTIKSDDVRGRSEAYECIVKGDKIKKPSIPESFNVLVYELRSLGIDVDLMAPDATRIDTSEILETKVEVDVPAKDQIAELQTDERESDAEVIQEIEEGKNGGESAEEEIEDSLQEIEEGNG